MQGLITNDINKLDSGIVYTALLTPQGKYICDFFLVQQGDDVLLDAPAQDADALIKRLSMYRLRADVQIAPSDLIVSTGLTDAPSEAHMDPRHPDMGWRFYGPQDVSEDVDWGPQRVPNCIPEHGIELTQDTFI